MKKRIAIIGSSDQQNSLIEKAHEMGYETHVFAWQTGYDIGEKNADYFYPISTQNKEEILKRVSEINVDGVASIGSDVCALSTAYVAEHLGKPTNSYKKLQVVNNKISFREKLKALGIRQPKFVTISEHIPDDLYALKYPLIVKPSDRSGSRGVQKIEASEQLLRAVAVARELSFERKVIVEEYIEGQCYSCECISYQGRHFIVSFTKREARQIDGVLIDSAYKTPAIIAESVRSKVTDTIELLLNNLGIEYGASSTEFIVRNGEAFIIENTPSMYADYVGSNLVPASTGYDYIKAVIDVACGRAPEIPTNKRKADASVTFIYADEIKNNSRKDIIPEKTPSRRAGHYFEYNAVKPYGGCARWNFENKKAYYSGENVIEVNSEFTAIWYALKCSGVNKIHVPYYISPTLIRTIKELDVIIDYYRIDYDFLPVDLCQGEDDAVLLINQCGLCSEYIKDYTIRHSNVIIDNSSCFYEKPVIKEGVYNVYSAKKFFPVADGGYLITSDSSRIELNADVSYMRARMLLRSFEMGEKDAYKEQMSNEQELAKIRASMSTLTRAMLSSLDYNQLKSKRTENYCALHRILGKFNLLDLSGSKAVPQFYPLMVARNIRNLLLEYNIFVPFMWRSLLGDDYTGTVEKDLAEKMVYLPIASEYSIEDMQFIGEVVTALLS